MNELAFLACPVGSATREGVDINLRVATIGLAWLLDAEPDYDITCPWLGTLLSGIEDDANPLHRARGLRCTTHVARRCDGIVLWGARISEGMEREIEAVTSSGGWVSDLTSFRGLIPENLKNPIAHGRMLWEGRL